MNFQSGAFGDPAQLQTLVLFWTKMELLHYPGAGETKAYLEEELARQKQAAQMQRQAQEAAAAGTPGGVGGLGEAMPLEETLPTGTAAGQTTGARPLV